MQEFEDVQYLDEYNDLRTSEAINIEAMNIDINTSNKKNVACNMQNSNMEKKKSIDIENETAIANDMKKYKNIIKNKHTEMTNMKNMKERPFTQKEEEPTKEILNRRSKRNVATQRLEKTMEYTNDLVCLTAKDQQIRKKYYRKKIKLMKRDIAIKKRIVTALENLSNDYNVTNM